MPNVVTITMNPAVDLSTATACVAPVRKLRCGEARRDPGGGGINVARVVRRLGGEATAIYPVGGPTGQLLERLVEREGVASIALPIEGDTREDFTVVDQGSGEQYRFVLPGPHLREVEWRACLKALGEAAAGAKGLVCASGSLPPGVPDDFYAEAARVVARGGGRLVLDTSGAALKSALEHPLHLIKPNLRELRELVGPGPDDTAALVGACRDLARRTGVEVIALTLGAEGALLVAGERAWRAAALPIEPVSTVGAGDSFLAAMVWALSEEKDLEEAFRHGIAGGSAALLEPGTGLCHSPDLQRLLGQVRIEELSGS